MADMSCAGEKRVLVVTPEFDPDVGGVGRSALRLCHLLPSFGYTPTVLVVRYTGGYAEPSPRVSEAAGSRVTVWEASCELTDSTPADQRRLIGQLRAHAGTVIGVARPGLVHLFFLGQLAYACALACRARSLPYVASARGSDVNLGMDDPARRAQLAEIFGGARAATFVNRLMRDRVAAVLPRGIPSPVIYNSLWPASYASHAPPEPDPGARPRVGAVVPDPRKKGLAQLVELCRPDAPWTLSLLVSRPERVVPAIREALDAGRASVTVLAPPDVLPWYASLSVYVQASPAEGCPNTLFEAIHCGVPTVCTRAGAALDLLEDEVSTRFVPANDAAALLRAVERTVSDGAAARALAANARRSMEEHCSLEVERARWRALYEAAQA